MTSTPGRAVIAGGAGFIGSHLCELLLSAGAFVECFDNFLTGSADNVAHLIGEERFRLHQHDVTTPITLRGPIDVVYHLASPASPADYARLPIETLKAGSLATFALLDLAKSAGAHFVLVSTSEVYGDPDVHPQPESYWGRVNPVGRRSSYDEAKRFAEALVTATAGQSTTIVRVFNTYGPRMRPDDGRAVPEFIRQALARQPLTIAGTGNQTRSFCYVTDTVNGLLSAAARRVPGPINIGNPHELTILELAHLVCAACGVEPTMTFVDPAPDDPARRCPDISAASALLGWKPTVGIVEGLRSTVSWIAGSSAHLPLAAGPGDR